MERAVPQPTFLRADATIGSFVLAVSITEGYAIGDWVCLSVGKDTMEYVQIVDFGSFILGTPLVHRHSAGIEIIWVGHSEVGQPRPLEAVAPAAPETTVVHDAVGADKGQLATPPWGVSDFRGR